MVNERYFERVNRFSDDDTITLPKRSTEYSAGYDFYACEDTVINPMPIVRDFDTNNITLNACPVKVNTGIKAHMGRDEVLLLFSRSSAPIKLGLVMANSVGCIDSDYYDVDGEIAFLFYNFTSSPVLISKGDKLGQGIFFNFLKTIDDDTNEKNTRVGGFGSTGK